MDCLISEGVVDCISDWAEPILDLTLEEGIIKEIPIISSVYKLYSIGKSMRDKHNLEKLDKFVKEINAGIVSSEQLERYKGKIAKDKNGKSLEMQYILILFERYISMDKPSKLAKLFLAYLDDRISWNEFSIYAEMVDRFLPGDYGILSSISDSVRVVNFGNESFLRLMAMGLVFQIQQPASEIKGMVFVIENPKEAHYKMTEAGEKLIRILG